MSVHVPGSFVAHAKLPELGSGEVIFVEKGTMRVRFASGERDFLISAVTPHLQVTHEAPASPAPQKRAAAKGKSKSKAKAKS